MKCLVLSVMKYSDDKLIADTFSEHAGRQSLLLGISHGRRAPFRHTLFQPFALLDVEVKDGARRGMWRPTAARSIAEIVSDGTMQSTTKSAVALFLAELLRYALRAEPPSEQLFEYLSAGAQWYAAATEPSQVANFHLVFATRLSNILGYGYPTLPHVTLAQLDLQRLGELRLSRPQRQDIIRAIVAHYQKHVPDFPEMRSLDILTTLFDA